MSVINGPYSDLTPQEGGTTFESQTMRAEDFADPAASNFRKLRNQYVGDLGGDEITPITSSGWTPFVSFRPLQVGDPLYEGLDLEAVIMRYTTASGTGVEVKIEDDLGNVIASMASPAFDLTPTRQTLTGTMPATTQWATGYVRGTNDLNGVMAWGYLRTR